MPPPGRPCYSRVHQPCPCPLVGAPIFNRGAGALKSPVDSHVGTASGISKNGFFSCVSNLETLKFDGFEEFATKRPQNPQINHGQMCVGPGSTYFR